MIHYTGFYFCTRSNWDGGIFYVRNLVSIDGEDQKKLIIQKPLNDEKEPWRMTDILKPEVFNWLEENVKDERKGLKGWCCGNDDYNSGFNEGFSLFFYRRKDAKLFIKTWSIHKIATETYNQNTYENKILDPKTNKLVKKIRN